MCVSEAFCPNIQPRAHARLTGLTTLRATAVDGLKACRLDAMSGPFTVLSFGETIEASLGKIKRISFDRPAARRTGRQSGMITETK